MIALSQLGGKAAFCCLVGDYADGAFYSEEMQSLGIDVHNQPVPGAATGTSLILITPDAERTMNTHLGISSDLGPEHVDAAKLADSKWLYIEGYLFSGDSGRRAVSKALEVAQQNDVKVAVTCSDGFIVDCFKEPLTQAIEGADLVFANLNEAAKYTGASHESHAVDELRQVAKGVVVTLGADGALVDYAGERVRVPGVNIAAVDATGAGDMFAGAFLYGICKALSLTATANLACRLGAEVVSQTGPRIAGDIKRFLPS
jgi:sugar/nucleoside kinase (ribokinase family)